MRQNEEPCYYNNFLKHLVQCFVGKREFACVAHHQLLPDYCTITDEACAHLFYENNVLKWNDMATSGNHKSSEVMPKYTNGGNSTGPNATSRRYGGWSKLAYNRFNELYFMIERDRDSTKGKKFNEQFRLLMMNDYLEESKRSKKMSKRFVTGAEDEDEPCVIMNELFADSIKKGMAEKKRQKDILTVSNVLNEDDSSTSVEEEDVNSDAEDEEDDESLGMQCIPLNMSPV
jgi:hypothetical protein